MTIYMPIGTIEHMWTPLIALNVIILRVGVMLIEV